jgi:hypothetical protein
MWVLGEATQLTLCLNTLSSTNKRTTIPMTEDRLEAALIPARNVDGGESNLQNVWILRQGRTPNNGGQPEMETSLRMVQQLSLLTRRKNQ